MKRHPRRTTVRSTDRCARHRRRRWLGVLICAALAVCTSMRSQETSPPSKRPMEQPALFLQLKQSQERVYAGSIVRAILTVTIADGWHINIPHPVDDALIGTSIEVQRGSVIDSVAIQFPAGIERSFGYADQPLEVYEGEIAIPMAFRIAQSASLGTYRLSVKLDYQACNDHVCLAPASVVSALKLHVVLPSEPAEGLDRKSRKDSSHGQE